MSPVGEGLEGNTEVRWDITTNRVPKMSGSPGKVESPLVLSYMKPTGVEIQVPYERK